ncbi:MAG: M56 family metallopeptidase [Acidobacteriota bacterium]
MSTVTIASWLLTYLIHSTLLLCAAWLFSRALGERLMPLQETLLRVALIGGLLTATAQAGLGFEPVGGVVAIDGLSVSLPLTTVDQAAVNTSVVDNPAPASWLARIAGESIWPVALVLLWAIGSLLAMLTLGRSALDLRRLLKTRTLRPGDRLLSRLAIAMGMRRKVSLSTSPAIAVPFATGIQRPEVCCPERVDDLAIEHKKSLFAHELAHLVRRDPAWQLLYRLAEAIFFLQPLNRLVRRRLEEIAEHLTDERAVACTGDRLGLARCLVVVAHWGVSPGLPVTAFASGPRLERRIRHLISGNLGHRGRSLWTIYLGIAAVLCSAILMPAIAPSPVHAESAVDRSATAPTKTWSSADEAPANAAPPEPAAPSPPGVPTVTTNSVPAPEAPALPPSPAKIEGAPVPAPNAVEAPSPVSDPTTQTEPVPPSPPAAPEPPSNMAASPDQRTESSSPEPDARRRDTECARAEARTRARETARTLRAESREMAERARELAREAALQQRLTDAEREKLRAEARELSRHGEAEALEQARVARELARREAERQREFASRAAEVERMNTVERERLSERIEALRAEARTRIREANRLEAERSRELSDRARKLAEEIEAERQAEAERHRQ